MRDLFWATSKLERNCTAATLIVTAAVGDSVTEASEGIFCGTVRPKPPRIVSLRNSRRFNRQCIVFMTSDHLLPLEAAPKAEMVIERVHTQWNSKLVVSPHAGLIGNALFS